MRFYCIDTGMCMPKGCIVIICSMIEARVSLVSSMIEARVSFVSSMIEARVSLIYSMIEARVSLVSSMIEARVSHVSSMIEAHVSLVSSMIEARVSLVSSMIEARVSLVSSIICLLRKRFIVYIFIGIILGMNRQGSTTKLITMETERDPPAVVRRYRQLCRKLYKYYPIDFFLCCTIEVLGNEILIGISKTVFELIQLDI